MEFLTAIEAILAAIDFAAFIADVYSWIKGRENRIERKEARKAGADIPARDRWNRRVVVLTLVVGILTAILICRNI